MWNLKKDFLALFQPKKYAPIDGLRAISCISIITIHVISLLNALMQPYPSDEWMKYLKSYSLQFSPISSLNLEIFFMLSGFLLTLKCSQHNYSLTFKGYLVYIFKRACRFWPGILLVTIIMFVSNEPKGDLKSVWLFYQNSAGAQQWAISSGPLWSVSLDMQIHIVLPILLYAIGSISKNSKRTLLPLYLLIILSVVHALCVFDPKTMNLLKIVLRYNIMVQLLPEGLREWIETEYNVKFTLDEPTTRYGVDLFMSKMYFPLVSRYASFLIGSILAITLTDSKYSNDVKSGKMKKYVYFTLISIFMFALMMPASENSVNDIVMIIAIAITRQLFTTCQAFILFSAICSLSHPYHCSWVKSFLSCSIWTPIANLSYLVYVIHLRVAFDFVLSFNKIIDFTQYSIDILAPICCTVVFLISLIVATVWSLFIEKPFERFINQILPDEKLPTKAT